MKRGGERGVTLIDTVVGVSLMLVVFVGITAVFRLAVDVVSNNKARAGAIALADQRMEYIRSLTYASVGTAGGIPSGALAQSETMKLNGVTYTRRTIIVYVDDSKDGTGASDNYPVGSPITADYKAVKVDVAWTTRYGGTRHVDLVTRVSPPTSAGETNPCSGPCGTLTLNVVNASNQPLAGASVSIVNSSASPAVNFSTFTNASGVVTLLAAPAASGYQIVVTNTGYSTAQTYSAVAPNTNPNPGNLTVSNNQTTSGTFSIDTLGTKDIRTWTQILSGTWTELLADTSKVATSSNISIGGGTAKLSGSAGSYPSSGELQSIAIGPATLATWKKFTVSTATPAGTGATFRFYDGSGTTLIPEAQLPGNAAGFATTSVDLSLISTSTYPAIRVDATLTSTGASTPTISPYTVQYTYGPQLLPNIAFTLQGGKTIGTDSLSNPQYKYKQTLNSGTYSVSVIPNLEFDTYTLSVDPATGYDIASACHPQSEYTSSIPKFVFAPGAQTTSNIMLAAHTANSLAVKVTASATGIPINGVSVRLNKTGYDVTQPTDSCGQTFFSGLSAGTYTLTGTATGYQAYTDVAVSVSGTTQYQFSMSN